MIVLKFSSSLLILLLMTGCVATIDQRGKTLNEEQISQLKTGQSQEEVLLLIGSPSSSNPFDDKQWHYLTKTTATKSFFTPTVVNQEIIILSFNDDGKLQSISSHGPEKTRLVPIESRTTPTTGHDTGFFEQIFGNFGRIYRGRKGA